jgi:hypothetical protein
MMASLTSVRDLRIGDMLCPNKVFSKISKITIKEFSYIISLENGTTWDSLNLETKYYVYTDSNKK